MLYLVPAYCYFDIVSVFFTMVIRWTTVSARNFQEQYKLHIVPRIVEKTQREGCNC